METGTGPVVNGTQPRRSRRLAGWLIAGLLLLLVLAIAIPNLLRSRMAGGESTTLGSLRTLVTAQITYASTFNCGFSEDLNQLGAPSDGPPNRNSAELVDPVLAGRATGGTKTSFVKSGYKFSYRPGKRDARGCIESFTITARPLEYGKTGRRNLFVDESGVIRITRENRPATAQDPPIY